MASVTSSKSKLGRWGAGLGALLAIGALVASACSSKDSGSSAACDELGNCGDSCDAGQSCPVGQYCNGNVCTADCVSGDSRCPEGTYCVAARGQCVESASGTDTSDGLPASDGGTESLTNDQVDEIVNGQCAAWTSELEAVPAKLELVVDVSSSMSNRAPGSNLSKWEETRDALIEAIPGDGNGAPGLSSEVAVGLLYYPNMVNQAGSLEPRDVSACVRTDLAVPMSLLGGEDPGSHRVELRTSMATMETGRGTPTHDAYKYAVDNMVLGDDNQAFSGNPYVLLITDGMPTMSLGCVNPNGNLSEVDPQPIVEEVASAAQRGVKTFIVGSPGSETGKEWLSQAAVEGGTAPAGCSVTGPDGNWCHMDLTTADSFADALRGALSTVTSQLGMCTYGIPVPSAGEQLDLTSINVIMTIDGQNEWVLRDNQGDCSEGWQLVDNQIVLCPSTCDRANASPGVSIVVVAGCLPEDITPIIK